MKATKSAERTTGYPRLSADLLCVKSDGGIAVRSRAGGILLQGDDARFVVETLFPLLDGTRTYSEIITALPRVAPDDVKDLLRSLREHGLLLNGRQPGFARPVAAQRLALLESAKVLLVGQSHRTTPAVAAIHGAGVGTTKSEGLNFDGIDLAVGIFDEHETRQAYDFASAVQQADLSSLTCIVGRVETTIGPLAIPHRTACWNCGRLRLQANTAHNNATGQVNAAHSINEHLARAVCDALCLGHEGSPLINHLLVFDELSKQTSLHSLLPVPACSVCRGPAVGGRSPRASDQDRSDDAMFNLSLQMLSWFMDDRTGIVNRVVLESANDTGLELPVVATAITAAAPDETAPPRRMPIGWGKGCNAATAVAGAVAEAIERYAGSMPNPERIIWSRPDELNGDVLHPGELALYADDQFRRPGFPYVRFDPDVAHPWIAGEWASNRGAVWLPAILVFLSLDIRREQAFCQGTSNGMAAGTVTSEAQLRAILELVERDAFMTSWLCKRPGHLLRIDGTLEADLKTVLDGIAALGAQVELVLLQSACGYPTIACLAFGDGIKWPGVTLGLGTDPDPRSAVRQAILELGQTGPYLRKMMTSAPRLIPETASDVSEML